MIKPDDEGANQALAAIISARARSDLWNVVDRGWVANIVLLIVICHTFDRLAYRASPDNLTTHHGRMEISPPPLFLYQTTTLSWPYSLGTLPIQTRTQTFRQVLEPNQSTVSIAWPCIELEDSPPPIRPHYRQQQRPKCQRTTPTRHTSPLRQCTSLNSRLASNPRWSVRMHQNHTAQPRA